MRRGLAVWLVAAEGLVGTALAQSPGGAAPPPAAALPAALPEAAAPAPPLRDDEAPGGPAAGPAVQYRLRVQAPSGLDDLLERHLDLARFRGQPDITDLELGRLIAAAPAQARALLETEGYFAARVIARRDNVAPGEPALVVVEVQPGPRAVVGRLTLEIQGDLQEQSDAGDPHAAALVRSLEDQWPLRPGTAFTQSGWTSAKNAFLARLRADGYPAASYAGTVAQVDATTHEVRVFVVADSGPRFRIGPVRVEGVERTTPEAVLNLAPFERGEIFTEKMLLDYQERLQRSGLYAGVAVELEADPQQAEAAPVIVRVRENKLQSATVSVGFSTNTGPRAGVEYTHRRVFGLDWIATGRLKLARDQKDIGLDLVSYPKPDGYRNLFSLASETLDAGGARTDTQSLRYGRSQDTERIGRLYYLEFNRTRVETASGRTTDRALWANYEWTWRRVDSLVFPTRGVVLQAQGGGGVADDAEGDRGPFARALLHAHSYWPLPGGRIGLLRAQAGQVFRRDGLRVPDSLLFRAGGDDSVRGYGYRTLGPLRDGEVVGGPVLASGSAELMWPLSQRLRDWYGAVFIDAGHAAQRWADWKPVVGYGAGVRWRSPIGPLRADIAYGEALQRFRLHLSVGVSF